MHILYYQLNATSKLDNKHSWVKGFQFCSNEGPCLFQREIINKGFTCFSQARCLLNWRLITSTKKWNFHMVYYKEDIMKQHTIQMHSIYV